MLAWYFKARRSARAIPKAFGLLGLLAALTVGTTPVAAQHVPKPVSPERLAKKSPFNLSASATLPLQANLVFCGLTNTGGVCQDPFNSPTTPGGFWPAGTANQYIFNSGLQLAGVNSTQAGPWAGDTVGAYFFDARGTQEHGANLTQIFSSLNPQDLANWPAQAVISDTSIFNSALIGSKSVSDEDSWVSYWDGDPNRISERSHPMGIRVEQRSLAFNAPAGAENTLFFIYKFTNVTNEPAFQQANEAKFGVALPDAGWRIDNIYSAFAMDPDVTTSAGTNFSTALLPFNMGIAYHSTFSAPDFDFVARSDLYAPPFFAGPGFVGVKYLRSPINAQTNQQVGLTLFTNTTNPSSANSLFPDPEGVKQLFRFLKGDPQPAAGDPTCTIANPVQNRLCYIGQAATDTRFTQVSGPFSLDAGQSQTIVVAYTHGAPVRVPEYTPGTNLPPGTPTMTPGVGTNPILTVEKMAGLIQVPASAVEGGRINEKRLVPGRDVVRRSLIHNAMIAQTIFDNKFLLPRPPEPPVFTAVPGNNQVTVIWEATASETTGDPFYSIASDPNSPLYDPNYRQFDVEGYRIYRATGLSGGFELVAQFDKTGTTLIDRTGQLDPAFVPEEGTPYAGPVTHSLSGEIIQYPSGSRIRDAVGGGVVVLEADTVKLNDTGVPFIFVDRNVRNGITYRYVVTAFDVNSLASGPQLMESPRQTQTIVPRSTGLATAAEAQYSLVLRGATTQLNPDAPLPTIDAQGRFSGPMPPTNGLRGTDVSLVLPQALKTGNSMVVRIDSVVPFSYGATWYVTTGAGEQLSFGPPDGEFHPIRGEPTDREVFGSGISTLPADTAVLRGQFANAPKLAGSAGFELEVGNLPHNSGLADWAYSQPQFFPPDAPPPGSEAGGSRWFEGNNETLANPTLGLNHGQLTGIAQIGSFTPYFDAIGAIGRRYHQTMVSIIRAADFEITWQGGRVTSVKDLTHDVSVIFKPTPQASYGFMGDNNGDGQIDNRDVQHLDFVETFGGFKLTPSRPLLEQPVVLPTDASGDHTQDGAGFSLYINGEVFFFVGQPPAAGTWKLRTYNGDVVQAGGSYTFTPSAVRVPAVPGLTLAINVESSAEVASATDLGRVHTVPDPYYVRSAFDIGPSNKALRFVNLPNQAIVRIYSLNGTLVRVLTNNDITGGGEIGWDLRNRNNQFVASGVYFYVVEAPNGETKTGKFTIVQFAR